MHRVMPEWQRPRSQVVDHVDGQGPNGPRGFDLSNMQAMTRSCHGRKTAKEDGGYGLPKLQRNSNDDPPPF